MITFTRPTETATSYPQEMVLYYLPYIKTAAGMMAERLPSCWGIEAGDLVSAGAKGVLLHAEEFDPNRGMSERSFMIICAKRGMLDELRDADYLKRNLRTDVKQFTRRYHLLMASLDHQPTIMEYASAYALREEEADALASLTAGSERSDGETQKGLQPIDFAVAPQDDMPEPDDDPERDFTKYMNGLTEMQRTVLTLRYLQNKEWTEIALLLNIPENSAYYHQRNAFKKMRPQLERRMALESA